jgi:hypothetical protein
LVRPFGLRDVPLIWKLRSKESRLDLPQTLVSPHSSLQYALQAYLLHGEWGADTYVLDEYEGNSGVLPGFAQVRPRRGRAEWDIVALAPSLDLAPAAQQTWQQLLQYISLAAREQGILRIFGKAIHDSAAEEALRAVDMHVYAHEDVFRCDSSTRFASLPQPDIELDPVRPEDDWGLHHLYNQMTPSSVQLAEGYPSSETGHALNAWMHGAGAQEYVLRDAGGVHGYVSLLVGRKGYGVRVAIHSDYVQRAEGVLLWSLTTLSRYPAQPVYCTMREYEGGSSLLRDYGFDLLTTQTLLVKQLAVRFKEALLRVVPALEQRVEPAQPIPAKSQ